MHYFYKDKIGGSEVQTFLIGRELAKRGHSVYYLCENRGKGKEELLSGITIIYGLARRLFFKWLNWGRILKKIKSIQPDIIYVRTATPYLGVASLISKLLGKKLVWGVSEDITLDRNFFIHTTISELRDYKKGSIKKGIIFFDSLINQKLYEMGVRGADLCITQNQYQKKKLKKVYKKESIIIKNAHPVPTQEIKKEIPLVVLWVNALSKRKRPLLFVKLAKKCENLQAKFIMIGKGKKEKEVIEKSEELKNFQYVGEVEFEEINHWFSKASILVNTSQKKREGFPNSFIQALLHKVVIVSLEVNPDSILTHYNIGLCSKTFSKLVKDIKFLIKNYQLRKEMSERAYEVGRNEFNIERVGKLYENQFYKLYEKKRI